jgi:hypothetical protein
MLGFNGGLIGKDRNTSLSEAVGVWTLSEQVKAKRNNLWPTGFDPDAFVYIAAVEAADSNTLEYGVKTAIDAFVVGCKADGIWSAIKASCILAGARTLSGALVPLVGTAPTNINFVSGDYARKTGLVGNGSTKYLNSNRAANADPQNSHHMATYRTTVSNPGALLGNIQGSSWDILDTETENLRTFSRSQTGTSTGITGNSITGFIGLSRSSSSAVAGRANLQSSSLSTNSVTPVSQQIYVFARGNSGVPQAYNASRLAFYSIGESIDLLLFETRVTTLINAIAEAIP